MVLNENPFDLELNLDPQTRWALIPQRLPGEIEGPDPRYARGAIIRPLVQIIDPNGRQVDTIKSREGGELSPDTLVEFSAVLKRSRGSYRIEAEDLASVSADRVRELQAVYEDRILDELAKRLDGQLPMLRQRLLELESQIETEVSRRIEARTKEIRRQERDLRAEKKTLESQKKEISAEKEKVAAERAELQEQLEHRERERPSWEAYNNWIQSQKAKLEPLRVVEELEPGARPPQDWTEQLYSRLTGQGFVVSQATLHQFLAAMLSAVAYGDLVILAGPPGVGKTSIVEQIAPSIRSGSAIVPVRPAWMDPTDLFGFFNPVHRIYQPTLFVEHLLLARQYQEANRLYMICFDEVNLARIENYAADLLVKLEKSRAGDGKINLYAPTIANYLESEYAELVKVADQWTPEQAARMVQLEAMKTRYPPALVLPLNLVVLGTVNVDETTYMLSPKVLDRAFVVQFPAANWSRIGDETSEPGGEELIPMPANWVHQVAERDLPDNIAQECTELWKTLCQWQDTYLKPLGIDGSYRLATSFSQFMKISYHGLSLEPKHAASAFTQMRILPRLSFTREESAVGQPGRNKIQVYKAWCEDKRLDTFPGLAEVLRAMDERSPDSVLQFWQ